MDSLFKTKKKFRYIFILDSRNWFASCRDRFDPKVDLVLTYDLGLKHEIESRGGLSFYVDHLINNAGWGKNAPVVNAKVEDWDRTFRVNLRAPMLLTQLVLPTLIEKRAGAIVNIGSVSGKMGQADTSAYCASKFGLIGFTESLFQEVREYGIKVSVILPGFVDTPLIPPTRKLDRSKMICPEDIAQAVLFVLSCPPNSCPVEITVRPQKSPYK